MRNMNTYRYTVTIETDLDEADANASMEATCGWLAEDLPSRGPWAIEMLAEDGRTIAGYAYDYDEDDDYEGEEDWHDTDARRDAEYE